MINDFYKDPLGALDRLSYENLTNIGSDRTALEKLASALLNTPDFFKTHHDARGKVLRMIPLQKFTSDEVQKLIEVVGKLGIFTKDLQNEERLLFLTILSGEIEIDSPLAIDLLNQPSFDLLKDDEKVALLLNACYFGNFDACKLLLEKGVDVNAKAPNGITPLMCAVEFGTLKLIKLLIDHKADITATDLNQRSALIIAYEHHASRIVKILIESLNPSFFESLTDREREIYLCIACYAGSLPIAKLLIEKNADINAKDSEKEKTALMAACESGNLEFVKFLLENKADVNARGKDSSPLETAYKRNNIEIFKFLIENNADFSPSSQDFKKSLLVKACEDSKPEMLKLMLDHAKLNEKDPKAAALMKIACEHKTFPIVKLLAEYGFDVNIPLNSRGETPFTLACATEDLETIETLIKKNADLNAQTEMGPVLTKVIYLGKLEVVQLLLKNGANVNLANKSGWTPLMEACYRDNQQIARLLLENKADANAKDKDGKTALNIALNNNYLEIVKLFDTELNIKDILMELERGFSEEGVLGLQAVKQGVDYFLQNPKEIDQFKKIAKAAAEFILATKALNPSEKNFLKLAIQSGILDGTKALNTAIKKQNLNGVMALVSDIGVDPNRKIEGEAPPLFEALKADTNEIFTFLCNQKSIDLNVRSSSGNTLMHQAIEVGNLKAVEMLLHAGMPLDILNDHLITPGSKISKESDETRLKQLFQKIGYFKSTDRTLKDSKLNETLFSTWLNSSCYDPATPLKVMQENGEIAEKFPNLALIILRSALASDSIQPQTIINVLQRSPQLVKGPQSKVLLLSAIQKGDLEIIKELVRLGVDIKEPFSTFAPLKNFSEPPLHFALSLNRFEIVEYFIEEGISLDSKNNQGLLPIEVLFQSEYHFENHQFGIIWALENGATIPDSSARTLIEHIKSRPSNEPYPLKLVLLLFKKGVFPTSELNNERLLVQILRENNTEFLHYILNHPEKFSFFIKPQLFVRPDHSDLFIQLSKWNEPHTCKKLIELLVSQQIDINEPIRKEKDTLLHLFIKNKNFPMAHFMLNLGADPHIANGEGKTAEDLLKEFHLSLASLQQIVPKKAISTNERKLADQLTVKNLAHLVGDGFASKMKASTGDNLEGNVPEVSMEFMCNAIDYLVDTFPSHFSQDARKKLLNVSTKMSESFSLPRQSSRTLQEKQFDLKKGSREFRQRMENLEKGGHFIAPWGWSGTPGHAMLLVVEKIEDDVFLFRVFNTGSGLQYHKRGFSAGKQYANTVKTYRVPLKKLEDTKTLEALFEPEILGKSLSEHKSFKFEPEDMYNILSDYEVVSDELPASSIFLEKDLPKDWMQTQLSGTCSFRCLLAYVASTIGRDEYKEFKALFKEEVARLTLTEYGPLVQTDKTLQTIFHHAFPGMFRNLSKKLKMETRPLEELEKRLSHLETLHKEFKGIAPPSESRHIGLIIDTPLPTKTEEVQKSLSGLEPSSQLTETAKFDIEPPVQNPFPDCSKIQSARELEEALITFSYYVNYYKKQGRKTESHVSYFLRNLASLFIPESKLSEELKNDPDRCERLLYIMTNLAGSLFEVTGQCKTTEGPRLIALYSALAVAWILAQYIDEKKQSNPALRLKEYGLAISNELDWIYSEQFKSVDGKELLHPDLQKERNALVDFFKLQQKEDRNLFDFINSCVIKDKSYFHLAKGDATYAEAYAKSQIIEKNAARAAFESEKQSALKEYKKAKFWDETVWVDQWLYINSQFLPLYFQQLRQLAIMANAEARHHPANAEERKASAINLYGPKLYSENEETLVAGFTLDSAQFGKISTSVSTKLEETKTLEPLSNLPKEQKELKVEGSKKFNERISHLFLMPKDQNTIQTETKNQFNDILTTRTLVKSDSPSPLTIEMLIDYFEEHVFDFQDPDKRIFFTYTLFQPGLLNATFNQNPAFANNLLHLFDQATDYYEAQVHRGHEIKQSLSTLTFLLDQKQRALQWVKFGQEEAQFQTDLDVENELEKTRHSIRFFLNLPACHDIEIKEYLYLCLIDSYNGTETITQQQAEELILSNVTVTKMLLESKENALISPSLQNAAQEALIKHRFNLEKILKNEKSRDVFNECLKVYIPTYSSQGKWEELNDKFPIFQCKTENANYQINALTGEVFKNSNKLDPMAFTMTYSSLYKEVFGEEKLIVISETETSVDASDQFGEIQLIKDPKRKKIQSIHRWIFNERCTYVPKETNPYPKFPSALDLNASKNTQVWKNEAKNEFYVVNPKKNEIKCIILNDGTFKLPSEPGHVFEWVSISQQPEGRGIASFDNQAILWQEIPQPDKPAKAILQFPLYNDEQGNLVSFEKRLVELSNGVREWRWVWKKNPQLFMAKDQRLNGIGNFHHFLVLENIRGDKEVLIPNQSVTETKNRENIEKLDFMTKFALEKELQKTSTCLRITLDAKGYPRTRSTEKNAFLAYLTLAHAKTTEDYELAMQYLEGAFRFDGYSDEELRLLGWIFNLKKEKPVRETAIASGQADAVRLFAAWLVQDNFSRNPVFEVEAEKEEKFHSNIPDFRAEGKEWRRYWLNDWTWGNEPKKSLNYQLDHLAVHYTERKSKVPTHLRLENRLDPIEILNWNLEWNAPKNLMLISPEQLPSPRVSPKLENFNVFFKTKSLDEEYNFITRPDVYLENKFSLFYRIAKQGSETDKEKLRKRLSLMKYDISRSSAALRIILEAAMDKNSPKAQEIVQLIDQLDDITKYESTATLNNLLNEYVKSKTVEFKTVETEKTRFQPVKEQKKMAEVPSPRKTMPYDGIQGNVENLHGLYKDYFTSVTSSEPITQEPFVLDPAIELEHVDKETLEKSIQSLNKDLEKGVEKNRLIPIHKPTKELSLLTEELETQISAQALTHRQLADGLEQNILSLARRPLPGKKEELLRKAEILSGQQKEITIDDCIALFLQGDPEQFKKVMNLNDQEIQTLHQMIGDYLCIAHKANHEDSILKSVQELKLLLETEKDKEASPKIQELIQKIGDALSVTQEVTKDNPAAFYVFQYYLGIYLKGHQVRGLLKMIPKADDPQMLFPSILLQRIQGGGKTLVFGHLLALLKADGYHLSIHVPPTPLYGSSLLDMKYLSQRLFGQKERTLFFDDHPMRFTEKYLAGMKNTLENAIANREYVTMTKETLQAMRCKYLKVSKEIRDRKGKDTQELEKSKRILKEILLLLRQRAVFTLDEVHQALDPLKELNMPVGEIAHIDIEQAELIDTILNLAAEAKDENDQPLLRLNDNQQAQQNPEQSRKMKAYIVQKLLSELEWQKEFGLFFELKEPFDKETQMIVEQRKNELENYFLGKTEVAPEFLNQIKQNWKGQPNPADQVILTRQMLAGGWLDERFSKSVSEHYGFSTQKEALLIAIPYTANMKPSEGSEFSDRTVMVTNTLITYAVNGLNPQQVVELIQDYREKAFAEYKLRKEDEPDLTLSNTQFAQRFKATTGIELFSINLEDTKDIGSVKEALKADSTAARDMVFKFVIHHILRKVELYNEQIPSNGQNMASMAERVLGYSGSMDNPNIRPAGTDIELEEGTNGQTIDLLLRQNDETWLIGTKPENLLKDLIVKHPKREQIRAIIDVGCHFRGISNDAVATLICADLPEKQKGVLFFHPHSGKLCFMNKNQPGHYDELTSQRREVIILETGFTPEELFTYYDQDHITGADIAQAADAIAVMTESEHTKIHEVLQGARRLRELQFGQRIVFAIQAGALQKVDSKLKRPFETMEVGNKIPKERLSVRQLILFAHLNELEAQQQEDILLAVQKIEDRLQQHILDKCYILNEKDEQELLDKTGYLFVKNIAVDLFIQYAFKKEKIELKDYVTTIRDRLLQPLKDLIDPTEYDQLLNQTTAIIDESIPNPKAKIEVNSGFAKDKTPGIPQNINQESTHVQFRQQQKQAEKVQEVTAERVSQQEKLAERDSMLLQNLQKADHLPFDVNLIGSENFCKVVPMTAEIMLSYSATYNEPTIWKVNDILKNFEKESQNLLDENILVTSNMVSTFKSRLDLLGAYKKPAYQVLLVYDQKATEDQQWKLALCSAEDAQNFYESMKKMKEKQLSLPEGRSMWLLRPNGNPTGAFLNPSYKDDPLQDKNARRLFVQALFIAQKQQLLNRKEWKRELEEWLKDKPKELYKKYL